MMFSKIKCEVLHLVCCCPRRTYRLGELLESNPTEKDLGVLVDGKDNLSQQFVLKAWKANSILGCIKGEMASSARKASQEDAEVNKLETSLREMTTCRDDLKEASESLRKQWKHQFIMAEMYKDTCEVAQQMTPFMQEEVRAASKGNKLPLNSEVYGLLTVLMDWILDELLSKLKKQEERKARNLSVAEEPTSRKVFEASACGCRAAPVHVVCES
ncbi:coiled-coil domain-containing protein 138 isoform X2 [Centrocercus urophasianus]|uniref:coiled-coil domain-containing protein 138 isoform X2 n=1 Tax=Centrocercus urophasianus TaxID=9002 RepID=UPI001C64EA75|nr:coiled-coil domain-containing protein 138 isoform X2 [Centrocercus urophasianus]